MPEMFDAGRALSMYRLGMEDRLALQDRKAKLDAERRKQEARDLIPQILKAQGQNKPRSIGDYVPQQAPQVAPAQEPAPRPESFLTPDAEASMRRDMGDKGYADWQAKHHVPVYDPNTPEPQAAMEPAMPVQEAPPVEEGPSAQDLKLRLFALDPETAMQVEDYLAKTSKAERDAYSAKMEVMGSAAAHLAQMPPAQRKVAFLSQIAPQLMAAGWTQEELQRADLSDQGLRGYISLSMDAKTIVQEARQAAEFEETKRRNRVTEGQADRRLGISEGALNLARQREGRISKGGDSGGDDSIDSLLSAAGL